jgi:hypothetical protein
LKNNTNTVLFLCGAINSGYNRAYDQGECPALDKLQFMKQSISSNLHDTITLNYYFLGITSGYSRKYSITFNNENFGILDPEDVYQKINQDTIFILGNAYNNWASLVINTDSIYYQNGKIIKIKYQNAIYEKIP